MKGIDKKLLGGQTEEEFITAVMDDFAQRREDRRAFELQWQLNMNFVAGNQYCTVTPRGDIRETVKEYDWQQREVYNHLAPILETRLAKLSRVRPRMAVVPASGDDADLFTARTASAILDSTMDRLNFSDLVADATMWSETCGTVFYKTEWDGNDTVVTVVPPFEFYPDTSTIEEPDDCRSIIHARALPAVVVRDAYNVDVVPEDLCVFSMNGVSGIGASRLLNAARRDHTTVVEYYEQPGKDYPEGRYALIAGGFLVKLSGLPYRNARDGSFGFPFVKQSAVRQAGCLWGTSVIERAIPVQRAYNAVKNRKHEFLNRLAGGVLTVEDGSVDTDELAMDGLNPGRIISYRQGTSAPRFLDTGRLPPELAQEEDKLLAEFIAVSGVSELMRSSTTSHSVNSGYALQLLIEQDDTRLAVTAELVKGAIRKVAGQLLRLYKQFATARRVARVVGEDGSVECRYWNNSDITSDDVVFVTENELSSTPAQRQQFVFDLLKTGLLTDENGKLSDRTRTHLLDVLGFGLWETSKDTERLQIKRAVTEQLDAAKREPKVKAVDDHAIHIAEHTKYMLGGEFEKAAANHPGLEETLTAHLLEHRARLTAEKGERNEERQISDR